MTIGDYITLEQARRSCRIPDDDTTRDVWLGETITEVSREIDLLCKRHFYPITQSRIYDYQTGRKLFFKADVHTVTQVLHGEDRTEVLSPSSYFLYPEIGPPYQWMEISDSSTTLFRWSTLTPQQAIQVDGVFGYLENGDTPAPIRRACRTWVMYLNVITAKPGVRSYTIGDYSVSFNSVVDALREGPPADVQPILTNYTRRTDIATTARYRG